MKKKLLLFMALLCVCVSGAWAQDLTWSEVKNGYTYAIVNVQPSTVDYKKYYLNSTEGDLTPTDATGFVNESEWPTTAQFVAEKLSNGKFAFKNVATQQYLAWKGASGGENSNKGLVDDVTEWSSWTMNKSTRTEFEGTYYPVCAKRTSTNTKVSTLLIANNGSWNAWDSSECISNTGYSNNYGFVELAAPTNEYLKNYILALAQEAIDANNGTTIGMPIKSEVDKLTVAIATPGTDEEIYNAVTAALDAYNKTKKLYLPDGYYYMKNMHLEGDKNVSATPYAYNDYNLSSNSDKHYTLMGVTTDNNTTIWKVTNNGETINIVNGDGKGISNGTTYTTLNFGAFKANQFANWGSKGIYFTQGLHASNQNHLKVGDILRLTDWAHDDSQGSTWDFIPLTNPNIYNVVINRDDAYVSYGGGYAYNGGFFNAETISEDDIETTVIEGLTPIVTISNNTIQITYVNFSATEPQQYIIRNTNSNKYIAANLGSADNLEGAEKFIKINTGLKATVSGTEYDCFMLYSVSGSKYVGKYDGANLADNGNNKFALVNEFSEAVSFIFVGNDIIPVDVTASTKGWNWFNGAAANNPVGLYNTDDANSAWEIKTLYAYVITEADAAITANPEGTTIGKPVKAKLDALVAARAATGTEDEVYNTIKTALATYNETSGTEINLPSGYYYIKNVSSNYYAYNNYSLEANTNHHSLLSSTKVASNNGVWHIVNNNDGTVTITNGEGKPLVIGNQSANRDGGRTTISTLHIGNYVANKNGVYFTEGLHYNGAYKISDDATVFVTTWKDNTADGSRWMLEPASLNASGIFDVNIVDGNDDSYITVINNNQVAYNGGFVWSSQSIGTDAFNVTENIDKKHGYKKVNDVDKIINVTYRPIPTDDQMNILKGNIGVLGSYDWTQIIGYPDMSVPELQQANMSIAYLMRGIGEVTVDLYYDFLDAYNLLVTTDQVVLPKHGKFYTFKGAQSGKYLKATSTGLAEGETTYNNEQEAVFYVQKKANGKYTLTSMLNGRVAKSTGLADVEAEGEFEIGSAHNVAGDKLFAQCHLRNEENKVVCSWNNGSGSIQVPSGTENDWCGWTIVERTDLPVKSLVDNGQYFASFYSPVPVTIPSGVKAYIAKVVEDRVKLTQLEGEVLAANVPVVLTSSSAIPTMPIYTGTDTGVGEGVENDLQGDIYAHNQDENKTYYVLNKSANDPSKGAGFYKYKAGTTVSGFRAFYTAEKSANPVAAFTFSFDDVVTAINAIENENNKAEIYDLSGRRVKKATKGIFIVNGKKVMYQ